MNSENKHIVFDWNSTLLDDIHAVHECTNRLLAMEGHAAVSLEAFQAHYHIPFAQFYTNFGFSSDEIERLVRLESSHFHDHYEPMASTASLRDGAKELLGHIHKENLSSLILSNHIIDPIRAQLRRLNIEHFFSDVLAYADRSVQFRDMTKGERLRRFRMERGLTAAHSLIIGDSLEEIDIAHEQGLISVAITGGCVSEQRLRAHKPDYLIHSLHELKPILQERGFLS